MREVHVPALILSGQWTGDIVSALGCRVSTGGTFPCANAPMSVDGLHTLWANQDGPCLQSTRHFRPLRTAPASPLRLFVRRKPASRSERHLASYTNCQGGTWQGCQPNVWFHIIVLVMGLQLGKKSIRGAIPAVCTLFPICYYVAVINKE